MGKITEPFHSELGWIQICKHEPPKYTTRMTSTTKVFSLKFCMYSNYECIQHTIRTLGWIILIDKVDSNQSDNYYTKCMNSKLYPNRKQGWKNV